MGCGAGYFALKLSPSVGAPGTVFGVDIRKLPLAFVWTRAFLRRQGNIRVCIGGVDDPHLPLGKVDAVLLVSTYHELSNPEVMLDHIVKSLRSGGRLVVVDRSTGANESAETRDGRHEVVPEIVDSQLRSKGLEISERQDQFISRPSGERWWLIVAQKSEE